jgi:hypothetical protein
MEYISRAGIYLDATVFHARTSEDIPFGDKGVRRAERDAFLGREMLLLIGMTRTGVNDVQIRFRETHRLYPLLLRPFGYEK